MKIERLKLWVVAIWLYIWYEPFHKLNVKNEYYEYYDDEKDEDIVEFLGEFKESRWYVKPRLVSWLLLLPIAFIPLFIYGGFKVIADYFKFIFTVYEKSVNLPEKVSFVTKLDIVKVLS